MVVVGGNKIGNVNLKKKKSSIIKKYYNNNLVKIKNGGIVKCIQVLYVLPRRLYTFELASARVVICKSVMMMDIVRSNTLKSIKIVILLLFYLDYSILPW